MSKQLTGSEKKVPYWELLRGDHGLKNHPEYIKMIIEWLRD